MDGHTELDLNFILLVVKWASYRVLVRHHQTNHHILH